MKRTILSLAVVALLSAGAATAAEENHWVAAHGGTVHTLHANAMFFGDGDAERVDLKELNDGETRTFGNGPRAVTVTRSGDVVTIHRTESGDGDVRSIDIACDVSQDTCTVLTFPDDPERVMVAIEKERVCVNGEGDCDVAVVGNAHPGHHVVVNVDCEGEDCEALHELQELHLSELGQVLTVDVLGEGEGEPGQIVIRRLAHPGGEDANVFVSSSSGVVGTWTSDKVLLRCSEGDATITVDKDEAGDTFLCPKHSTPMERAAHDRGPVRVIRREVSKER